MVTQFFIFFLRRLDGQGYCDIQATLNLDLGNLETQG